MNHLEAFENALKICEKGQFNIIADYLMGLLFDFHETKWDEIAKLKENHIQFTTYF